MRALPAELRINLLSSSGEGRRECPSRLLLSSPHRVFDYLPAAAVLVGCQKGFPHLALGFADFVNLAVLPAVGCLNPYSDFAFGALTESA